MNRPRQIQRTRRAATLSGRDIDRVVLGTHGWPSTDQFLLGSVAERTLRSVEMTVLISRPVDGE